MVFLLNGGLSYWNSRKRPFENAYCSTSSVSEVKYKPRRISCIRDYPSGCGQNAPPVNLRQKENVVALVGDKENLVDGERRTDVVVADCVRTSEVRVEFQSHEVLKGRIWPEMAESSGGLVMDIHEMGSEDEKMSTNMEVLGIGSRKDLECLALELSKKLHEVEVQALVKREGAPENKTMLEIGALDDGMVSMASAKGSCSSVLEVKYKPRRVSCIRDYPPGCGRNAPPVNLRQKENVVALVGDKENLMDGERRTDVVVADCVRTSEVRVEFQSHEVLKGRIWPEMAESSDGLVMDIHEMGSEDEKMSTNMEVLGIGSRQDLECLALELSKELHEVEVQAFVKREGAPENKTMLEIGALDDGMVSMASAKGSCSSVLEVKYKPRRVFCIRDYPPGCGRNAPPVNLRQKENVVALVGDKENLVDGKRWTEVVMADCVRTSEVRVKFHSPEVQKSQIRPEMAESSGGLVVDIHEMGSEDEKMSTNMEILGVGSQKDLECLALELSKELPEVEVHALVKREDAPENETVLEIDALDGGMVSVASAKKLSPQQWPIGDANVSEETVLKKRHPRRRVSATRDYPPFCGRNALCPNEEECRTVVLTNKSFSGTEKAGAESRTLRETVGAVVDDWELRQTSRSSVVESKRIVRDGNVQKSELRGTVPELRNKSQAVIKKDSEDVRDLLGKVVKEIIGHSHDEGPNRRLLGDHVGLGCGLDRVIWQSVMAAPDCLWKQGNGASKSSPDGGMSRSKLKKLDFTGREKSRIVVRKNKYEAEYSRGNSSKGKSMFAWKAAYGGIDALLVSGEKDSFVHDDEQLNDSHQFQRLHDFDVRLPPCYGPNSSNHGEARNKMREMLRLFQTTCGKLLLGEERKFGLEAKLRQKKRIDLQAIEIVRNNVKEINTGRKILGAVPGVEVGDEFQYRVQLFLIGVHCQYQAGIDYMKDGGEIIAISIVASGGYDDVLDNADVLIYSGQGGNLVGHNKQPEDQKLERGNLALKNSISVKNPVRVIRGSRETKSSDSSDARAKIVMTYTYDGLYIVKRYWQEPGRHGKLVYKFELTRIPGQPELAWKEVKNSKKYKIRKGLCVDDISGGKELFPICAVNTVDNEKPPSFTYMTRMMYTDWYRPIPPNGCDCTNGCLDPEKCLCSQEWGRDPIQS